MAHRQIALESAAFLDSPWGREIGGVPRDEARRIAESFFAICYDELGKEPRFLDAEDVRELARRLASKFEQRDARVEHAPAVLEALVEHVAASAVMSQAFEVRRALPAAAAELVELVRSGRNAPEAPAKQDPFVHGASKLGRNDPCSCGSGKKFKKCHGKDL